MRTFFSIGVIGIVPIAGIGSRRPHITDLGSMRFHPKYLEPFCICRQDTGKFHLGIIEFLINRSREIGIGGNGKSTGIMINTGGAIIEEATKKWWKNTKRMRDMEREEETKYF